jgi:rhamnosyltransferase
MGNGKQAAIILLTKNGATFLRESLPAIFAQESRFAFEVLALDSGSTDGTLGVLSRHPVRVVEIEPHTFQHGRTRNIGAGLAMPSVEYLVYLTQDAMPLAGWLEALLSAVAADQRVAGAFSRHVPRPDCNPLLARRIVEEWPQVGGTARIVKQLDVSLDATRQWHDLAHFSNTSSCLRKEVWERIPFPEVDFAEDVAWACQALKAGYHLVYEPASAVLHSHSGSLSRQFRENVDHGRGVRLALGEGRHTLMAPHHPALKRIRRDLSSIWQDKRSPLLGKIRWTLYVPFWYAASTGGQWVGAYVDRWPRWLRECLSWQATIGRGK